MSAPVPGSSEDHAARKRHERAVNWAVVRGRQMSTPADARLAVEIAQKGLDELWKVRRYGLIGAALLTLSAVAHIPIGETFFAVAYGLVAILQVLAIVFMLTWGRRRYERVIELNAPLADPLDRTADG